MAMCRCVETVTVSGGEEGEIERGCMMCMRERMLGSVLSLNPKHCSTSL